MKNLWYVTLTVPVTADSEQKAFEKGWEIVNEELAKYSPTELYGNVDSVEEDES